MAKNEKKNETGVYAVYGMMECVVSVRAAGREIPVHFKGGRLSGYGVRPATFATDDPLLRSLIEATPQFRTGRITLMRR